MVDRAAAVIPEGDTGIAPDRYGRRSPPRGPSPRELEPVVDAVAVRTSPLRTWLTSPTRSRSRPWLPTYATSRVAPLADLALHRHVPLQLFGVAVSERGTSALRTAEAGGSDSPPAGSRACGCPRPPWRTAGWRPGRARGPGAHAGRRGRGRRGWRSCRFRKRPTRSRGAARSATSRLPMSDLSGRGAPPRKPAAGQDSARRAGGSRPLQGSAPRAGLNAEGSKLVAASSSW